MGRSTLLRTIVDQVADASLDVDIYRYAPVRSPFADQGVPGEEVSEDVDLEAALRADRLSLVVVDDAERLDDVSATKLQALAANPEHNLRIIAATTPEFARGIRSWVGPIRASGTGVMLGGSATEGDIFKTRFDKIDGLGILPGRGHVITRGLTLPTQIACHTAVCI